MKISYNWLKEFINIKVTPEKLAHDLSIYGHEVEKIEKISNDYILDFEITPNRGDLLSIFGMAREIATLYNLKLKKLNPLKKIPETNTNKIYVSINNPDICQRYTACVIDQIKIKESPKWIKEKLKVYGFRAINNIVDITNYIMIEIGQPIHAFDFNKINKGQINIGFAKENQTIFTLDGKERLLDNETIIIKDDKKIYDLAGIMGGLNSEIDGNTKTIVLQAAVFNPTLIRKTAKKLRHTTDASYRYERGVDTALTKEALNRAIEIINKVIPEAKITNLVDKDNSTVPTKIIFNSNKINSLLGIDLSDTKVKENLNAMNFLVKKNIAEVPSYRIYDVKIWQDLAEEVARKYGYNNLDQISFKKTKPNNNQQYKYKENLKDKLVNAGFTEIYSYAFCDEKLINLLGFKKDACRFVINSVAEENKYLRPDLSISLLEAIAKNPWAPEINVFELGKIFYKGEEKWQLGIATTEKKANILKNILNELKLPINIKNPNNDILDYLKIRKKVNYFIINYDEIKQLDLQYKNNFKKIAVKAVSEFPPTIRDLAFIVEKSIDNQKILNSIQAIDPNILLVELFDEFESEKLGKNKKSIAYHIWLQDIKKPMDQKKVEKIINRIIDTISSKFKATLRG